MAANNYRRMLLGSMLAALMGSVAWAVPPRPNLTRNSLNVRSTGIHYLPQKQILSPYLTFVPGNVANSAAVQYFNLVQPQIQQQAINQQQLGSVQRLQSEINTNADEIQDIEQGVKRQPTGYMTHRKYFNQPLSTAPVGAQR